MTAVLLLLLTLAWFALLLCGAWGYVWRRRALAARLDNEALKKALRRQAPTVPPALSRDPDRTVPSAANRKATPLDPY